MKKFYSLVVLIFAIFVAGCGSEKNLGITAEEFQTAYNNELERLCKQDAAEINNFKFHSEPDKNFKIVKIDENSGDFGFYSVDQPYFTLKFNIDKNSSEKYLDLVTLEIVDHVYYYDDSPDKIKIAELIKKSFAKAATQKKSNPEKIEEVEKSGIRGQTERLLKDNGLEFLYFAYNPGGKYFIASEDYAKTSKDFEIGEKAVKSAGEVLEQQKLAEQKQKEEEEYYKKHPEELQKKLQDEREKMEMQASSTENNITDNSGSMSSPTYKAVAVSGCIILDQDGRMFKYQKKCESCGNVLPGATLTSIGTGESHSSFFCSKCKNTQKVIIKFIKQ